MRILLTGASGFLGKRVLSKLVQSGHSVFALGRHVPAHQALAKVKYQIADLATPLGIEVAPWEEIDAVIHLAASGVKASSRVWPSALAVNVLGTQHLLSAVENFATRKPRVVVARTFYERLLAEAPALLENPYIATKAAASGFVSAWSRHYGGSTILATVFQIYGPGDDSENVLSYAARRLRARQIAHFGSGLGQRDWLFVEDAADALLVSLSIPAARGLSELDIGSGELTTMRTMVETMAQVGGVKDAILDFDPSRDRPDVGLALAAQCFPSGWTPRTSRQEGLRRTFFEGAEGSHSPL